MNLALETSFLLEPHDIQPNTTIVTKLRSLLNEIEDAFDPQERQREKKENDGQRVFKTRVDENSDELTKFLTDLGVAVINYDDEDVKRLATALSAQVSLNYKTNPKYHEMFKDVKIKMFIKNTLRDWAATNPLKLKVEIAKYLTNTEELDISPFVIFFRNLNEFFDSEQKTLKKLLKKFVKAKKTKQFSKPLGKTIKFMINRYEKLDDNLKTRFHNELDKLSAYVAKHYTYRIVTTFNKNNIENTNKEDANDIRIEKVVQVSLIKR